MDEVEWRAVEGAGSTPDLHATHEGVLAMGGVSLRCYQLSDGSRVFDADDIEALLGGGND